MSRGESRIWRFWHFYDSQLQLSDHLKYCFGTERRLVEVGLQFRWSVMASILLPIPHLEAWLTKCRSCCFDKVESCLLINCRPPGLNDWGGCRNIITQLNSTQRSVFIFFFFFVVVVERRSTLMNKNDFRILLWYVARQSAAVGVRK